MIDFYMYPFRNSSKKDATHKKCNTQVPKQNTISEKSLYPPPSPSDTTNSPFGIQSHNAKSC